MADFESKNWLFCIRGAAYALAVDIAAKGTVSPVAVYLKSAYDALWNLNGGTVGDDKYTDFIAVFRIVESDLEDADGNTEKLYTVPVAVTQNLTDVAVRSDSESRTCPLLPLGGLTFPNSN